MQHPSHKAAHKKDTASLFTEVGKVIKSRMQESMPLPFSQYQTLSFVAERESPSMLDVAKYFKIRAPSATFLVDELVRAGQIERKANLKDRRKVELRLTAKGKKSFRVLEERRNKVLNSVFGTLNESDRKALNDILEKVVDSV